MNYLASNGQSNIALLYFHITAVGCPNLKIPRNAWAERHGDDLVVKCNITDEIWYLTCQDNDWIGQIGNCSASSNPSKHYLTHH